MSTEKTVNTMLNNVYQRIDFERLPLITGAVIGGVLCGIKGYKSSKDENVINNVSTVIVEGSVGAIIGGLLGGAWFVSVPVICCRIYDRRRLDMSIFEQNPYK